MHASIKNWGIPLAALSSLAMATTVCASENVPHRAFAQWADLPAPGQFIVGLVYEESEAYHIWTQNRQHNVTTHAGGESYGIDINQGYIALQYGIAPRWAADLNLGYTSVGWRHFDNGIIHSTAGLMDVSFGVRYEIARESSSNSPWMPTLVFRAGAVLPGNFDKNFVFAPGVRSAAIEPGFLLRKHVGWTGFGVYGDSLYRWNRSSGNDQWITAVGIFQQIHGWELNAGYRHLQSLSGSDIIYDPANPATIYYPRAVRENSDAIEAGFSYTTSKRHIRYGFHSRIVFDGHNTDRKFWLGGSIDVPFGKSHTSIAPSPDGM